MSKVSALKKLLSLKNKKKLSKELPLAGGAARRGKEHEKGSEANVSRKKGLVIMANPDKTFHEEWSETRHPLNIPHPFQAVIALKPNGGKTTMTKNLIIFQRPFFERIVLVHYDAEYTKEYDDVDGIEKLNAIPSKDFWDGKLKSLIILEDLDYKALKGKQLENLDRLFGYVSTHKNVSIVANVQDGFKIPATMRRKANFWIIGKIDDSDTLNTIGRRIGHTSKEIQVLFKKYIKSNHDSLWFDKTNKSPYPIRVNGAEVILRDTVA